MIDITVDNNEVFVENKRYGDFNIREELLDLLKDVIEKAKYSGETISLHVIAYSHQDKKMMKHFVKEWH